FHTPPSRIEQPPRLLTRHITHLHNNPLRPIRQLVIRRPQVDHQIPIRLPKPNHRPRGDHIEHKLRRRPRFQPSRPSHHFRPHQRHNQHIRNPHNILRRRRTRHHRRPRPKFMRPHQRSPHIRCRPRRRDPNNKIPRSNTTLIHHRSASRPIILSPFLCPRQRRHATCN